MWDHMGDYGGWGGMGFLFMLLFWIIVVLVIAALIKWLFFSPTAPLNRPQAKDAAAILDERYARGEIDREEYQRKKADLQK